MGRDAGGPDGKGSTYSGMAFLVGLLCVRSGRQAGRSKALQAPAEVGSGKHLRSVWGGPVSGAGPWGPGPV